MAKTASAAGSESGVNEAVATIGAPMKGGGVGAVSATDWL